MTRPPRFDSLDYGIALLAALLLALGLVALVLI